MIRSISAGARRVTPSIRPFSTSTATNSTRLPKKSEAPPTQKETEKPNPFERFFIKDPDKRADQVALGKSCKDESR